LINAVLWVLLAGVWPLINSLQPFLSDALHRLPREAWYSSGGEHDADPQRTLTGANRLQSVGSKEWIFRKYPINYYLTVHRAATSREGSCISLSVSAFTPTGV
jgi:hypothetical protein